MANQLYPHSSGYASPVPAEFPTSRSASDPYLPDSPFFGSSRFLAAAASAASDYNVAAKLPVDLGLYPDRSYFSGHFDAGAGLGTYGTRRASVATSGLLSMGARTAGHINASVLATSPALVGIGDGIDVSGSKPSFDVIYNQPVLRAHNSIGQSDSWLSTSSLGKRPRFESTGNLPMYPQRPGEKICPHYMLTRTCKFGDNCKFDHPSWVLDGGIPDGKEVPKIPEILHEPFPARPGAPDCAYFLKTQNCKFGLTCKFNHPKANQVTPGNIDGFKLPQRPSEPSCSFYLKTGKCKFGQSCKYHHPNEIQISPVGQEGEKDGHTVFSKNYRTTGDALRDKLLSPPLLLHSSSGLPLRLLGLRTPVYPQRPGQIECDYFMKTGVCKFGESCRFHHPVDQSVPTPKQAQQPCVKLTLAGLPRREGAVHCPFYMKTGICKYGTNCKFDHPTPGDVLAIYAKKETASHTIEEEDKKEEEKLQEFPTVK